MFKKTIIKKIPVTDSELHELRWWLYDRIISGNQTGEIKNRYISAEDAIRNKLGCCSISNGDYLSYSDTTKILRGFVIIDGEPENLYLLDFNASPVGYINYTNDKSEFPWDLCNLFVELKGKMLVDYNSIYTAIGNTSDPVPPTESFLYDLFDIIKETGWEKIDSRPWVNNPNLRQKHDGYDYELLIEFKSPDVFRMKMLHILNETKKSTFRCELDVTETTIDIIAENTFNVYFPGLIFKLKVRK